MSPRSMSALTRRATSSPASATPGTSVRDGLTSERRRAAVPYPLIPLVEAGWRRHPPRVQSARRGEAAVVLRAQVRREVEVSDAEILVRRQLLADLPEHRLGIRIGCEGPIEVAPVRMVRLGHRAVVRGNDGGRHVAAELLPPLLGLVHDLGPE